MDDLDLALHGLWLGGLQILVWVGLIALCVALLVDVIDGRTRDVRVDGALLLAAAGVLDAEIDPSRVPISLFASFLLLGVLVGRRWHRAESRPA